MNFTSFTAGRLLIAIILLSTWELAALSSPEFEFAASRPTAIAIELWELLRAVNIFTHIAATGGAALAGLALGTLLGTFFGLLTWFSKSTAKLLRPFVLALGAMPILAIAPLMIIWFGIGIQMKIALACLSTVFVAFAQSAKGAENVSGHYVAVLKGMNASDKQIFVMAVIPGSLDWVFSAMKLNAGLALLGAFIGEFIATDKGLGYLVLRASNVFNVPRALAAALLIVALALVFDWMAGRIEVHRHKVIRLFCIPRRAW